MVEGANLNEKKRLWVRCQRSPCLLYSLFGFCFPLNSFMFPRIINSHFSTGQEVHSWTPPLPALLLCPCCPATAAQTQTMPGHIHTSHLPRSVCPTAGHCEFRAFRQAHAAQEEQRKGQNPAVSSQRAAADRGTAGLGWEGVVWSGARGAAVLCRGIGGWTTACGPKAVGTDAAQLSAPRRHTALG